jgi:hypothetical protein
VFSVAATMYNHRRSSRITGWWRWNPSCSAPTPWPPKPIRPVGGARRGVQELRIDDRGVAELLARPLR